MANKTGKKSDSETSKKITNYVMDLIIDGYTTKEMVTLVNNTFKQNLSYEGVKKHRFAAMDLLKKAKQYCDRYIRAIVYGRIEMLNIKAREKGDLNLQKELIKIYVDILKSNLYDETKAKEQIEIIVTRADADKTK